MGAVGFNHFVELLNGGIAVFDKASGERLELRPLEEFFAVQVGGVNYPIAEMLDPRILFDQQSQRWAACAIDRGSQHLILAVSQGPSPLGLLTSWTKHLVSIARVGSKSDYVTLGADKNGLYLSVLHFHTLAQQFVNDGHTVVAIKKPEIYQGTFQHQALYNAPSELNTTTVQPAFNFDDPPSGGHAWFIAKGAPTVGPPYVPGKIYYRRLQWNGGTAAWVDTTWRLLTNPAQTYLDYYDLDSGAYYGLNLGAISAPQAGGTVEIDLSGVGSRVMMATIRNGFLWTCQQVGLDGTDGDFNGDHTGSTVDRSAAQWLKLQINASGESLAHNAHGRMFDDCSANPYYYYFPSLMVNSVGDMIAGFSASKETEYIGAFFSWRLANGSTLNRPALIRKGVDYYGDSRWGDYSSTSLDPTDGLTIWTVQEYAEGPSSAGSSTLWGTWIAKIKPYP